MRIASPLARASVRAAAWRASLDDKPAAGCSSGHSAQPMRSAASRVSGSVGSVYMRVVLI